MSAALAQRSMGFTLIQCQSSSCQLPMHDVVWVPLTMVIDVRLLAARLLLQLKLLRKAEDVLCRGRPRQARQAPLWR